jgi:succinate dehydrogenase/fumarate reductase flavoprotein subunit
MAEPMYARIKEWPYPLNYGKENEVSTDVLILGGGIAGCHAAINVARKGAKVTVVEKGAVIRSGSGGTGVDHWHNAFTNPCSKVTPEEVIELIGRLGMKLPEAYGSGHVRYIEFRESYDALLDLEKMGVKIRDVDDEFVGAEFRDEKTKLMFAYDYEGKHVIRVQGVNVKPALYGELKRLGVKIYDRVMATGLLTEGGRQGARVVGAMGVNVRTGEFYIFRAKATLLATAQPLRLWVFSTELQGAAAEHDDPNCTGDGVAMAWKAGAEFTLMERSMPLGGGFRYPAYGTGNAGNTWYACTMVDANGKEIPWVDRDGRILKTVSERYRPAPGQKFTLHDPFMFDYEIRGASLIPDLPERVMKGEFVLPFYADLPSMPEHERRAIWGLMVGNEGKTRIPIYKAYSAAGFDPDKDMLQANISPPRMAGLSWMGVGPPQWRGVAFVFMGGVVVDWDLKTNLEGLYAAGNQIAGGGTHTIAATSGRYAGRKTAEYALKAAKPVINRKQIEEEKARVYAPIKRKDGIGWKELQAGLSRIMQDYCGEYKGEETLRMGLRWLNSIRESEGARVYARNPHELARTLECFSRLTVGEIIMQASLARKASSQCLDFKRLDYPEVDPPEWNKFVTTRLEDEELKVGELPLKYWLLPPNAPTYEENYKKHCSL